MGREAVLTNAALLSLWSFWTWLSQEPRDTCRYKKIPSRAWDPGPSSPLPAAPSETTHLESQGGPDLLRDRDKKEKSAPRLGPLPKGATRGIQTGLPNTANTKTGCREV